MIWFKLKKKETNLIVIGAWFKLGIWGKQYLKHCLLEPATNAKEQIAKISTIWVAV